MMRAAIVALLLVIPSLAYGYTVRTTTGSLKDEQSRFDPVDIGSSRFIAKAGNSSVQDSGGASTFGLKNMDSATLARTESTLSTLGARSENGRIIVSLPGDVLFDFDKSNIRADARPVLAKLASVLEVMPHSLVMIVGHTDSRGSDEYNLRLSEERAESVRKWLSDRGVASRMTKEGKGETNPVAPNALPDGADNPAGRQKNRRVEFIIGEEP